MTIDDLPIIDLRLIKCGPKCTEIVDALCSRHAGVTALEIYGTHRAARLVAVRHMAMYLCRQVCAEATMEELGLHFDRDHTDILHAVKKITGLMKINSEYAARIKIWIDFFSTHKRE